MKICRGRYEGREMSEVPTPGLMRMVTRVMMPDGDYKDSILRELANRGVGLETNEEFRREFERRQTANEEIRRVNPLDEDEFEEEL